ncbi:MAG: hypothetical protein JWM59_5159 [Verrucomicrobiales bacterium]|nr:hypothetical protein [Verrucomicrobiales bacterium]
MTHSGKVEGIAYTVQISYGEIAEGGVSGVGRLGGGKGRVGVKADGKTGAGESARQKLSDESVCMRGNRKLNSCH